MWLGLGMSMRLGFGFIDFVVFMFWLLYYACLGGWLLIVI